MAEVLVRRALEVDWPLVRKVRLRALEDSPEAFASTIARELALPSEEWQRRVGPGNWVLALHDDEPIGVAAGISEQNRPNSERHLVAMWVAPEWRGRGVAADLVEAVQGWSEAQGASTLTLWVAANNGRARRFYERMGFRPTGDRQPLPSNPRVDEERLIRPPAP
jgi:GNAT superfamily N-acetyltransferase